ncbi:MAG: ABC transporter permease [Balneolaceae bacterium]
MNLFKLSFSYLRRRPLNTLLNILLLSFGIATITVLLLFSYQVEENLHKNARGIDVVVGAKGSPIQLILSSIFHIDSPTGNIKLNEAKELISHRMVKSVIPLALGDNYKGYRIVGTTTTYIDHYDGKVSEGTIWDHEFEVVIGSDVANRENLKIGDEIISSHGLSEGGVGHHDHELKVTGILSETGTVLDRLILTGVETMWAIHDYGDASESTVNVPLAEENHDEDEPDHAEHEHGHTDHDHHHDDAHDQVHSDDFHNHGHDHSHGRPITDESYLDEKFMNEELTSMLIQYTSPIAAAQFPRFVNTETSMQAASPAFEITRLLNLLGIGLDAIEIFGYILILAAILGIFIALMNSMRERKYDLAIMRTLGGSRFKLFSHIILEGVIIALAGGVLGIFSGHLAVEGIGVWMAEAQQFAIRGFVILPGELKIFTLAVGIGIISSIVPAVQAYRTDIAETLSKS